MTQYFCTHETPIGKLLILGQENVILEIRFENSWAENDIAGYSKNDTVFTETISQLDEYFKGKRKSFSVSIDPQGTAFQKKVWHELTKIPYGATCSYGEIAKLINNPKGCRAVGMANGKTQSQSSFPATA